MKNLLRRRTGSREHRRSPFLYARQFSRLRVRLIFERGPTSPAGPPQLPPFAPDSTPRSFGLPTLSDMCALNEKGTALKKRNAYCNFKGRAPQFRCVGNDCYNGAIDIAIGNAHNQDRSSLGSHSEVEQPNLTSSRMHSLRCPGDRKAPCRPRQFPRP